MTGNKECGPDVRLAHEIFVFLQIHIKTPKVVLPKKFGHVNAGIFKMFPVVGVEFAEYSSRILNLCGFGSTAMIVFF